MAETAQVVADPARSAPRYADITDRCDRYRARLDERLAELASDPERRAFLDAELRWWEERYRKFQIEVACGVYRGTATAFDYAITIADIYTRRIKYGEVDPLESARHLQRCCETRAALRASTG